MCLMKWTCFREWMVEVWRFSILYVEKSLRKPRSIPLKPQGANLFGSWKSGVSPKQRQPNGLRNS